MTSEEQAILDAIALYERTEEEKAYVNNPI